MKQAVAPDYYYYYYTTTKIDFFYAERKALVKGWGRCLNVNGVYHLLHTCHVHMAVGIHRNLAFFVELLCVSHCINFPLAVRIDKKEYVAGPTMTNTMKRFITISRLSVKISLSLSCT